MNDFARYAQEHYKDEWGAHIVLPFVLYLEWEGLDAEEKKETVREVNRMRLGHIFSVESFTHSEPTFEGARNREIQAYYDKLLDKFLKDINATFWEVVPKLEDDWKEMLREHLYHVVDVVIDGHEKHLGREKGRAEG